MTRCIPGVVGATLLLLMGCGGAATTAGEPKAADGQPGDTGSTTSTRSAASTASAAPATSATSAPDKPCVANANDEVWKKADVLLEKARKHGRIADAARTAAEQGSSGEAAESLERLAPHGDEPTLAQELAGLPEGLCEAKRHEIELAVGEARQKVADAESTIDARQGKACDTAEDRRRSKANAKLVIDQTRRLAKKADSAVALVKEGELKDAKGELSRLTEHLRSKPERSVREQCPEDYKDVLEALADAKLEEKKAQAAIEQGKEECLKGSHCLYVGAYLASASFIWATLDTQHGGAAGHGLVSAAVPVAGYRYALKNDFLSLDIGMGSSLVSEDLSAGDTTKASCRTDGPSTFESNLPCQANSSLTPVFFVYPALTLGKKDIGFVTLMPLFGVGQTSLDGGFLPFLGVSVGAIGFTKSFVLKPGGE